MHVQCSLNFSNLCSNFVKKLVSELRKCRQLTSDQVVSPCTQWGLAPKLSQMWHPLSEALDPLVQVGFFQVMFSEALFVETGFQLGKDNSFS